MSWRSEVDQTPFYKTSNISFRRINSVFYLDFKFISCVKIKEISSCTYLL